MSDGRPLAEVVVAALGGDPVGLTARLCRAIAEALDADGAAISALTHTSSRWPLGATDEVAELLETVQFSTGEGPCVQAAATGQPVIINDLHAQADTRWPAFADLAHRKLKSVGAVFGFPLRLDDTTFGSINLYQRSPRTLEDEEITAVVDAATLVTAALLSTPEAIPDEVQEVLVSTDPWQSMHLAIGVVAALLSVAPDDALALMRAYAFARNMLLPELSAEIIGDRIDPADLAR